MAENYINLSNNDLLFEYELWSDHDTQRMIPHSLNKNKSVHLKCKRKP